jgi:hypothetical protein
MYIEIGLEDITSKIVSLCNFSEKMQTYSLLIFRRSTCIVYILVTFRWAKQQMFPKFCLTEQELHLD